MRLTLLAFVSLLALTLANALLLRGNASFFNAHDYAIFQITQAHAVKYEWDLFIWREIAAFVVVVVAFSALHFFVSHRRPRRVHAHDSFSRWVSNRRA